MVQLKSFKNIEQESQAAEVVGSAAHDETEQRQGGQLVDSISSGGTTSSTVELDKSPASWRLGFPGRGRGLEREREQKQKTTTNTTTSSSSTVDGSQRSSASSNSPATTILRDSVCGGNLTSDTSSSEGDSVSSMQTSSGIEQRNRARHRGGGAAGQELQSNPAQVVSVVGVEGAATTTSTLGGGDSSINSEEEEARTTTTLSSNEEYQLARVEMADDDDEEEEEEVGGEQTPGDAVTKIEIYQASRHQEGDTNIKESRTQQAVGNNKPNTQVVTMGSPSSAGMPSSSSNTPSSITHTQTPRHTIRLNDDRNQQQQQTLTRSQTSPSHLDQMMPTSPLSSRLERGKLTSPHTRDAARDIDKHQQFQQQQQQQPPPQSPALRGSKSTGANMNMNMNNQQNSGGDNTSQLSYGALQQAKYQGSKHFEIRWYNVRLFARPQSRVPSFISDNPIYRSLFGGAAQPPVPQDDSVSILNGGGFGGSLGNLAFDPLKPPYSPPLNHHKIPPTIDENYEMNCPNSKGAAGNTGNTQLPGDTPHHQVSTGGQLPATATTTSLAAGDLSQPQPPPSPEKIPSLSYDSALNKQQQQQQPGQARCILNNISGQVFSGQMTAILGPSGVGKTSLLNSLTGRNTMDGTGRVSLIGATGSKRMSVVTVPQNDVLPGKLTTMEDLRFTSRLKNPQSGFDHARNIERLVKHLHMEKFLHTKIDKLSGGEARRLSIARELLSSPDIMILDEPTSGLDANTCKKIITALRDIVEHSDNILDKPMSIIITIHQPQQEVYQLFHRVYVMAMGGRVVYEGSPQMLLPTLLDQSSLTRVRPQEQLNENPAIVAIEVASGEFGEQVINELAIHHEYQVYEEFLVGGLGGGGLGGANFFDSPIMTPRSMGGGGGGGGGGGTPRGAHHERLPHKSPMSVSRFDAVSSLHRKRLNSIDSSLGRPTPQLNRKQYAAMGAGGGGGVIPGVSPKWERMPSMTSLSYASTYDEYLPEVTSRLKVDKRLRRSVVIKSHFISHTITLISRCWLLTRRDMFLMGIRILGFLLVAGGTVQIFSGALDPLEHQCPQFESEVDDMASYIGALRGRLEGLLPMLRQGNSVHMFFFHLLLCITMVTSALTGLVFPLQMRMFIREYKNGWYSPASFIMSQTIAELPADIIGPLISVLIAYPLCHQPDSLYQWRLIGYILVFIATSIICKSQAQIVGAFLMDSVENSVFISCVCVTVPALLSGIPLRVRSMSTPLQWASYTSFLRYAFESLMELRYGYGMCPCDPDLVSGPLHASARAIPPHLENLATGLLVLNQAPQQYQSNNNNNFTTALAGGGGGGGASDAISDAEHENLFLKFLNLVTDAGNLFAGGTEIQECSSYRSLYLLGMGLTTDTLTFWALTMVGVFVLSRFLTYFVVRTVIKLRRC